MNIPVPPIFLYERDYNSYEVMDGQQRITAIRDFYSNAYALRGLETWPELNGRYYRTLPEKIKAGVDRRSITSIVLLKESTENEEEASMLRETVFERLNTGGVKLERQEIRNALYRGPFNNLLDEITKRDEFREIWDIPRFVEGEIETNPAVLNNTLFAKMGDSELVLRFFALRHATHYRRGMQGFLDLYMWKATKFRDDDIRYLRDLYLATLTLARDVYGEFLFKIFDPEIGEWDKKPHKAFHDSVMVGLQSRLHQRDMILGAKSKIIERTKKLFIDNPPGTFTGRGNTKADILDRIKKFDDMIKSALAA